MADELFTLKDFDRQLTEMGYRINFDPNRKYWTIIGKGWQRPKRLYKLGEEYTNDRIMERISENSYAVKFQSFSEPQPKVKVYRVKGSLKNAKKIGGLRGLYTPASFAAFSVLYHAFSLLSKSVENPTFSPLFLPLGYTGKSLFSY